MIAALIIIVLYSAFIIQAVISWKRIKTYDELSCETDFSIIIPYRNESKNLPDFLDSLNKIEYPVSKFELIFINDESEDNSEQIVKDFAEISNFRIKLLNSKSGKKDAIQKGIENSDFNHVLQLDSDNVVSKNILASYSTQYEKTNSVLIAGAIINKEAENYFQKIAMVEFSSLLISSAAFIQMDNPIMINAANFSYKKSVLDDLNIDGKQSSSGDDIFLLNAVLKKYGSERISFLKNQNALVETSAPKNIKQFVNQRLRWTSKDRKVKNTNYLFIAFFIFISNFYLLSYFIWNLVSVANPFTALLFLLIKLNFDAYLIYKYLKFANRKYYIKYIVQAFILSVFQISIIGIAGHFIKTKWKGRSVKV